MKSFFLLYLSELVIYNVGGYLFVRTFLLGLDPHRAATFKLLAAHKTGAESDFPLLQW